MKLFLVSYDVAEPDIDDARGRLRATLKGLFAMKLSDSEYLVRMDADPRILFDLLVGFMGAAGRLYVAEIVGPILTRNAGPDLLLRLGNDRLHPL